MCNKPLDLIDPYVDDVLGEEARTNMERHLMVCPICAHEVRSLEQARALLREACPAEPARPAFRERMAARLEDAMSDVLKPAQARDPGQWSLPYLQESR